jgi:hypothetical protein
MNKKELRKEFDKRVYLVQSAVTPELQRKRINEAFDWMFDLIKQAGINTNVGGPASAVSDGGEQLGNEGQDTVAERGFTKQDCLVFAMDDCDCKDECKLHNERSSYEGQP